ncbi:MAG: hypothetical protein JXO22_02395, partial [Phycisphaerae bacterium]|nr:hypothetical protein [Phycisphaerae bacterium]
MKLATFAALAAACLTLVTAQAQSPPVPPPSATADLPPRPSVGWLRITGDRVGLRVRPDSNSLLVARLDCDAVLQSVGEQFGWYAVLPPEGVFSLVSTEYVDRRGEHDGVVSLASGNLRVRAGSLVSDVD